MRALAVVIIVALFAGGAWLSRLHWLPTVKNAFLDGSAAPLDASSGETSSTSPNSPSGGSPNSTGQDASVASNSEDRMSSATSAPSTTSPAHTSRANAQQSDQSITGTSTGEARGSTSTTAENPQQTQDKAERFVAKLTQADIVPVTVERADHFVSGEQLLSLIPLEAVQTTTVAELNKDTTISADTPITVVREVEQVNRVTPEKLIAQSAGNLDAPIQILRNDKVLNTTIRQVLQQARQSPSTPIDIVTKAQYFEQTTPRELAQLEQGQAALQAIKIIRKHHGVETATVAELMRTQQVKAGSLFYVRTVREGDEQGIWGIVHDGIIDNFARGMAIRRGKEINTYKVNIPQDADEQNKDATSSYLGRLIFNKSKASYVFNFVRNRMGRNPDKIFPGQEIVIIDFQPDELIDIYKHFVEKNG